jgi:hypothetical protein
MVASSTPAIRRRPTYEAWHVGHLVMYVALEGRVDRFVSRFAFVTHKCMRAGPREYGAAPRISVSAGRAPRARAAREVLSITASENAMYVV